MRSVTGCTRSPAKATSTRAGRTPSYTSTIKLVLFSSLWLAIIFGLASFARWKRERERLLALQKSLAEIAARAAQGAAAAALPVQRAQHDLLAHAVDVERADRLLARLADLLRASLAATRGRRRRCARSCELLRALRADHAGALRGSRDARWNVATTSRRARYRRCCCSRCSRTPSSTAWSAASSRWRFASRRTDEANEPARDGAQHGQHAGRGGRAASACATAASGCALLYGDARGSEVAAGGDGVVATLVQPCGRVTA